MAEERREQSTQGRKRRRRIKMTGTALKIYGCVTMLFYTIGMSIVQNGLIHVKRYDSAGLQTLLSENPDMMLLSGWASIFQLLGGLAVPVFAFLLVEGFMHTSSYKKYVLTMLGFALLSEIPYDLAMSDALFDFSSQNALFTMTICLIMLYALRMVKDKKGFSGKAMIVIVVVAAILWGSLLKCNFSLCIVLLCAVYYLMYDRKGMAVLMGAALSSMYVTGPLSAYAIWNYEGERGWNKNKYVFYIFYPAHLLILGVISHLMGA